MPFSISNLAWSPHLDNSVGALIRGFGFSTIDVVPSKYFNLAIEPTREEVLALKRRWKRQGITIHGMQSLLHGLDANIFQGRSQQDLVFARIKRLCRISTHLGVTKMTFGSPSNRRVGELPSYLAREAAMGFFWAVAEHCSDYGIKFCLEPAPKAYGGDFLVTTSEVLSFVETVSHPNLAVQLDSGAALLEGDLTDWSTLSPDLPIGHVHISAPQLAPIDSFQNELRAFIDSASELGPGLNPTVEMLTSGEDESLQEIQRALAFVSGRSSSADYGSK